MSATIHASRSRYEAFNRCMRYGFIQYHWNGIGIVRKGKNIFLTTGIWTHKGFEWIFRFLMKTKTKVLPEYILEDIIRKVTEGYFNDVFPEEERKAGQIVTGFDLLPEGDVEDWQGGMDHRRFTDEEMNQIQQRTFNEQAALCEAMIRVFVLRVLPAWMEKYAIVTVENDMAFPLVKGDGFEVIQSATIDLVFKAQDTKDLILFSLKTASTYSDKDAKQASHDTQGLSETWAFEEYLRSQNRKDMHIEGIQMLHVIKGQRRQTKKGSGIYEQKSPLTRGYRKVSISGVEYAHSLFYPKSENESGWGRLGKGWEPFDVYGSYEGDEVGGIKGWITKLAAGEIQPENGDVLAEQLVVPLVYSRRQEHIASWLRQTKARELDIAKRLFSIDDYIRKTEHLEVFLDEQFPQNNQNCHGMYGNDCPYLNVCWGTDEERWKPLDNGFVYRTPHHKAELVQIGTQ